LTIKCEKKTEDNVEYANETTLQTGRSLIRPQNKVVEKFEKIDEDANFGEYLKKNHKFSDKLKEIVVHALAMVEDTCNARDGILAVYRHLESLQKFGFTAFISPLYGSGELAQSFCRSSAVNGGVYLLRRTPLSINAKDSTLLLGADPDPDFGSNHTKSIPFRSLIVSQDAIYSNLEVPRILRRISIIKSFSQEERNVIVIPPTVLENESTIHCVILDQSACVSPAGYAVMQLSTLTSECCRHKVDDTILQRALRKVLSAQELDIHEVHHVSFSFAASHQSEETLGENIHVTRRPNLSITLDGAYQQAKEIFKKICPDHEFLVMSTEKKKERMDALGESNDEEKDVLGSAVTLIDGMQDTKQPMAEN